VNLLKEMWNPGRKGRPNLAQILGDRLKVGEYAVVAPARNAA
jgi:hypothetical protein